jgi:hypothetical protein
MMTFAELLDAANESKTGRNPGQWTPRACEVWREADPGMSRLRNAAAALARRSGRPVAGQQPVCDGKPQVVCPAPPEQRPCRRWVGRLLDPSALSDRPSAAGILKTTSFKFIY